MISEESVKDAIKCCKNAIREFYKKDYKLIDLQCNERSMMFRIGIYLYEHMKAHNSLNEYDLDCEYNRKGINIKTIDDKKIIPDILIHKRDDDNINLVAIEIKKSGNSIKHDKEKLEKLTDNNGKYRYSQGLVIVLRKKSFRIIQFIEGNECDSMVENV